MSEQQESSGAPAGLIRRISRIGRAEGDDRATRTRKTTLVLTTLIMATLVIPWGIFYVAIGVPRAGAIPLTYAVVSYAGIAHFARTRDDRFLRYEQIVLFIALPVLVHVALGGFVNSSGVVVYTIVGILGALSFAHTERPWLWFTGYAALILILVPVDTVLRTWAPDLPERLIVTFFAINMITTALMVFMSMTVYVRERRRLAAELDDEKARSDRLLLNVLPESIAERLKDGERPIADRYDNVAVLFADIVDFTPLSESLSADDLVGGLNGLFSVFDELANAHGVEKVKTIGDSYMVVSGAPEPGADVDSLAKLALEMREAAREVRIGGRAGIEMRFGMDVGPAVAGVIGESKFIYDVYGDTVNMASRMESSGESDCIQITERFKNSLNEAFEVSDRGMTEIKGKGAVATFFLNRRADA